MSGLLIESGMLSLGVCLCWIINIKFVKGHCSFFHLEWICGFVVNQVY